MLRLRMTGLKLAGLVVLSMSLLMIIVYYRQNLFDSLTWTTVQVLDNKPHFEGIRVLPGYKLIRPLNVTSSNPVVDDGAVNNVDRNAEIVFYNAIEQIHVTCDDVRRYGNAGDGGWDVCMSQPFAPSRGKCTVYSFGINNDFSFDDAVAQALGCQVFAFDPSMNVKDYVRPSGVKFSQLGLSGKTMVTESGWKLMTLDNIRRRVGNPNVVIDLLKIDIEWSEWHSFVEMLSADTLRHVRQLVFEMHTFQHSSNRSITPLQYRTVAGRQYNWMLSILTDLELAGFRRYLYHVNPACMFTNPLTNMEKSQCYELGYLNMRFLL